MGIGFLHSSDRASIKPSHESELELTINKKSPLKELNIVIVSDVHLGTIVCNNHLERIVEKINSLNPDLILLPGDIIDEDIEPAIRENLGETLRLNEIQIWNVRGYGQS